uniref:Uncharacterized protein n=1 Tax=Lygus hesperus TaxID=30085 RepID=A0A0A9W6E8_LYGHE
MRNPANHPFTHSKFFTFEDDATIYRMLRGGATVPQVARTLSKSATFIEKRLHNAQFKARVQYLLRVEKRENTTNKTSGNNSNAAKKQVAANHLLRRSPYEQDKTDFRYSVNVEEAA